MPLVLWIYVHDVTGFRRNPGDCSRKSGERKTYLDPYRGRRDDERSEFRAFNKGSWVGYMCRFQRSGYLGKYYYCRRLDPPARMPILGASIINPS
ncbi:hypothetical protein DTO164E3_8386 [Paecilomyces variotii]|nr:hypothetical protein DTO164E3_8386 [Paecilomyces variotii]KAJ9199442.1 hypothetical protein DTO032I3_4965 [Paecilomyces variotii]KAJ9269132.1 hypothetical protein DTO212C5_4815 [Paecilomyces variotii]KAJ9274696.1 hypothetical protein DTO021D3_8426 [Paecilomyces variotii]KAJ9339014.1 hypothetical protein DTO027B6_8423 [Paecilomyces variotii]